MFDIWNERSARWWAVVPLRLIVGYGFVDADEVDVNEQNEMAIRFYQRMGFRIVERVPVDPHGLPFPILHMELDASRISESNGQVAN